MCGTILVAVGQHQCVRSIEATSLHVGLGAHVLVLTLVGHILTVSRVPCLGCVGCLTHLGLLNHIIRLGHTGTGPHIGDGPCRSAGGSRGPLSRGWGRLTI